MRAQIGRPISLATALAYFLPLRSRFTIEIACSRASTLQWSSLIDVQMPWGGEAVSPSDGVTGRAEAAASETARTARCASLGVLIFSLLVERSVSHATGAAHKPRRETTVSWLPHCSLG